MKIHQPNDRLAFFTPAPRHVTCNRSIRRRNAPPSEPHERESVRTLPPGPPKDHPSFASERRKKEHPWISQVWWSPRDPAGSAIFFKNSSTMTAIHLHAQWDKRFRTCSLHIFTVNKLPSSMTMPVHIPNPEPVTISAHAVLLEPSAGKTSPCYKMLQIELWRRIMALINDSPQPFLQVQQSFPSPAVSVWKQLCLVWVVKCQLRHMFAKKKVGSQPFREKNVEVPPSASPNEKLQHGLDEK